jgi:hypothetical protein
MKSLKPVAAACTLALGLLAVNAGPARAADTQYGLVTIENPTPYTLNYSFRWGEDNKWQQATLPPGQQMTHSWRYDYANHNVSPTFYVKFDMDLSPAEVWQTYTLDRYASADQDPSHAKHYKFVLRGNDKLVDLIGVN